MTVVSTDSGVAMGSEVRLALSSATVRAETLQRNAVHQPDGTWRVDSIALPVAGRGHISVEVLISDFEQTRLEGDIDLPR